jgi:hypothetical protein
MAVALSIVTVAESVSCIVPPEVDVAVSTCTVKTSSACAGSPDAKNSQSNTKNPTKPLFSRKFLIEGHPFKDV